MKVARWTGFDEHLFLLLRVILPKETKSPSYWPLMGMGTTIDLTKMAGATPVFNYQQNGSCFTVPPCHNHRH